MIGRATGTENEHVLSRSRRNRCLSLAAAVLLFAAAAQAGPPPRVVSITPTTDLGPLNRDLGGTTHGTSDPSVIADLASIGVPHICLDTWFEVPFTTPDDPTPRRAYECAKDTDGRPVVDFAFVDRRIADVRATGAEPLVILDYMPPCLSRYSGGTFSGQPDASRHPPRPDAFDEWEELVYETVLHLATTPGLDVRWFEAWNEPNLPQFFEGTPDEYLAIFDRIESAIRRVEADVPSLAGELRLGGPAVAFPDPYWLSRFLDHVVTKGRKLEFVSWHWYASYPLFGPLVGTPPFSVPPANVENPLLKPRDYADHTEFVRNLVAAAWARRTDGAPVPFLWLDEWNLNAGREPRHDTTEAAAFVVATLGHMLRAGLDRSSFFNVEDAGDLNFNQGMFFAHRGPGGPADGTPKPVFAAWRLWSRMEDLRVETTVAPVGDPIDDAAGAIAARSPDGTRLTVLLYNWTPRAKRTQTLRIEAPGSWFGSLSVLPADAATGGESEIVETPVTSLPLTVTLDDSSIAFLDLTLTP